MIKKYTIGASFVLILFIVWRLFYLESESKNNHQFKQIGLFKINLEKTNFGFYNQRRYLYKDLTVSFTKERFEFNMAVPFINYVKGKWKPAGASLDEWNNIFFDTWDYSTGITGEQFTECCDSDNSFYFNSMTPQKDSISINRIWFTKVNEP